MKRNIIHCYAVQHIDESNKLRWFLPIGQLISYCDGSEKISPDFYKPNINDVLIDRKYYIAVKNLIIEWQDYQDEVAGFVSCSGVHDTVANSNWIRHAVSPAPTQPNMPEAHPMQQQNFKQLLHFVKLPGRKTTFVKIPTDELQYVKIDLNNCPITTEFSPDIQLKSSWVRTPEDKARIHEFRCELKSLFDETEILPIKHAHMTVEIIIK